MTACIKQAFESEGLAKRSLTALKHRTGQTEYLNVYRCDACGFWHYGHPRWEDRKEYLKRQQAHRDRRRKKKYRVRM